MARSTKKKRAKKARVDLRVRIVIIVVKMNHPYVYCVSKKLDPSVVENGYKAVGGNSPITSRQRHHRTYRLYPLLLPRM